VTAAPERRLWSVEETADYLNIAPGTLRNMVYQRRGPRSYKVGGHRRFRRADVDNWLERNASDAQARRVRGRRKGRT